MKKILPVVLLIYFVLSGYTASEDADGVRSAMDRIIYADIFGIIIAIMGVLTLRKIYFTPSHLMYLVYLALALVGVFGARNPAAGTVELLVLAFNWAVSLALLNLIMNNGRLTASDIVQLFLFGGTVLAIAGFIQLFAYPDLFGEKPRGALSGTFRNTGQAGAYFGAVLAVSIPAMMSGLIKRNQINILCNVLILAALLLTFKRAALIGLSLGAVLFAISLLALGSARDRKIAVGFLALCVVAGPILYYLFQYSIENVESMRWRFEYKFRSDAVEDFSEGFFSDNLTATGYALSDHPFMGSGLGNIIGQYTDKFEIHSTYLSVLANTGLAGFAIYLIFMGVWITDIIKNSGKQLAEQRYLAYFMPFLVGLLVSWTYTYHLRKREFWIIFIIALMCGYAVRSAKKLRADRTQGRKDLVMERGPNGYTPAYATGTQFPPQRGREAGGRRSRVNPVEDQVRGSYRR